MAAAITDTNKTNRIGKREMANKNLFSKFKAKETDTFNEAGGRAYALAPAEALTQYVVTGCINDTFYATAETQLEKILELANQVDANYLAKLAVFARKNAYMKDSPALLLAVLSTKDVELFKTVFNQVIDNAKMLKNFVQIMRSGVTGRASLGSAPKKLVQTWLLEKSSKQLLNATVGNSPSLADVIKMVHPKPKTDEQEATLGYLIGREYKKAHLPEAVKQFEEFKQGKTDVLPKVDFRLLTGLPLMTKQWKGIAANANWQMTRMNLNTFDRHGVFHDKYLTRKIAKRLADVENVRQAKVFPYQLMTAYFAATNVPKVVRDALQDAMEVALENVPKLKGKTYVLIDVSGSMQSPVTGYRQGSTTTVRCVDVAALFAAALLKTGEDVEVIPFDTRVHKADLNPRDSVMTLARHLANYGGGGTACGLPLAELNTLKAKADTIIYFSDNESWADRNYWNKATTIASEWEKFKRRNPRAKLILTDLQPYGTSQAKTSRDVLNIGGFSDQVFNVIDGFLKNVGHRAYWTNLVETTTEVA